VESTAALNSKVAALEDEMRIVKGEVKQVLTEIRSAILAQDSPFIEGGQAARNASRPVQIVPAVHEEPARVEIVMPKAEPAPAAAQAAPALAPRDERPADTPQALPASPHQEAPRPVNGQTSSAPSPMPRPAPRWSLLTVASLAAWAEEAFQRIGAQRLAILLDLCEVSGYLPPEARQALARVGELDLPGPEQTASPMEVTVLLRQLDALLQGDPQEFGPRLMY
jgi:hypothetical protein